MKTDRKSTRLNSSHTVIYTLSLHDALPICAFRDHLVRLERLEANNIIVITDKTGYTHLIDVDEDRSEEHTSELQSHSDLHSFPTRRSSDLCVSRPPGASRTSRGEQHHRHHRQDGLHPPDRRR